MDLNKNFENATVSIPYNDFVKALVDTVESTNLQALNNHARYINDLVGEVVMDKISSEQAIVYDFFKTPLGKFILLNKENFKSVYSV